MRLVKKSAQDELAESSNTMKKMIEQKENELQNLRKEFERIKSENASLCVKIEKMLASNKKIALEKHFEKNRIENKQSLQNSKRG